MRRSIIGILFTVLLLFTALPVFAQDASPRTCQVSAAYTDKAQCDVYEADASTAAFTLTLIAPSKRRSVVVVKTDSSSNAVTIATAGTGATINGEADYLLRQQQESAVFYANGRSGSNGVWRVAAQRGKIVHYAEVSIASAAITGTSAGQLGHADGVVLVAAPGTGKALEFISAVVINDYATAAYTGGGNVSVNYAGSVAGSGVVTFANSIGAAADKLAVVFPVVPTNNQLIANTGLNLVAASAPTQPGTAAGVVRVKIAYRVHTTGL
jgi:hypothetical protein